MCGGGLFGGGSSPSAPEIKPAPVAPAIVAPISATPSTTSAGEEERRRRRAAMGQSDTILTSGLGDTSTVQSGGKTLLGQ